MNRDVCEHFNPAPCAMCRRLELANIIEQDPTTTWGYREASHAAAAELRRLSPVEQQRDHARACYGRAVRLLVSIHSLMYPPPIALPDGRTRVFRPNNPDPHTILQWLSDRIRALPEELDAIAGAEGASATTQPEALWLAERLEHGRGEDVIYAKPAAAKLRRLHALNGELLEALNRIADPRNIHFAGDAQVVARAAIAKEKGEQHGTR